MLTDSDFNFRLYFYEVIFEEVNTNWFERLFSDRQTKLRYTIREISKSTKNIYYLSERGTFYSHTPEMFWDNPSTPQNIIIQAKMRQQPCSDNVIFSSKEIY